MDATGFIKERVDLFKDFSAERLKLLVDGSRSDRSRRMKRSHCRRGGHAFRRGVERDVAASRWAACGSRSGS